MAHYLVVDFHKESLPFGRRPNFTFPNTYHVPSHYFQYCRVGNIASLIMRYFPFPKLDIAFRHLEMTASLMPMPETPVHKDHSLIFLQHNIRRARQFSVADPIAQSPGEKILPYNHFRLRIPPLDSRHAMVALFRCHSVCHNNITNFQHLFMISLLRNFLPVYHSAV